MVAAAAIESLPPHGLHCKSNHSHPISNEFGKRPTILPRRPAERTVEPVRLRPHGHAFSSIPRRTKGWVLGEVFDPLDVLLKNRRRQAAARVWAGGSLREDAESDASSSDGAAESPQGSSNDPASSSSSSSPSSSSSSSSSARRENKWKSRWWKGGRWRWKPIIPAQEITALLFHLGIVMFAMRLLRPGIPLPGSEPRPPTSYVSVQDQ